jgi:hypothetical protein
MHRPFSKRSAAPPVVSTTTKSGASAGHSSEGRLAIAQRATSVSRSEEDDARASSKHRAALEALFAPKKAEPAVEPTPDRTSVKMVTVPVARESDPRAAEREKRLAKLLGAEGRAAVSKAADDYANAGFQFPAEQDVLLKLLDCEDEDRVRHALALLRGVLADEPPKRRALLDARLRHLETDAEARETRDLATGVRRQVIAATSSLAGSR